MNYTDALAFVRKYGYSIEPTSRFIFTDTWKQYLSTGNGHVTPMGYTSMYFINEGYQLVPIDFERTYDENRSTEIYSYQYGFWGYIDSFFRGENYVANRVYYMYESGIYDTDSDPAKKYYPRPRDGISYEYYNSWLEYEQRNPKGKALRYQPKRK